MAAGLFMVVTSDGTRAFDNQGDGLEEDQAVANARERTRRAEEMGLSVTYEVARFVSLKKEAA